MNDPLRSTAGFSLVELMVTVSLIVLITALCAAYTSTASYKLEGATNTLCAAMQKTRMEAIMRNSNVALSLNADKAHGVDDHITIWIDSNSDGIFDEGEELIETIPLESQIEFDSVPADQGGPSVLPPNCDKTGSIPGDGVWFNTTGNPNNPNNNGTVFKADGTVGFSGVLVLRNTNKTSAGTYAIVLNKVGLPIVDYYPTGASKWRNANQ